MREQFNHWIQVEVRWGDMDALGHVNNAKYFTYCESARISYFQAVDLWGHRDHDRQGPALVTANLNFRRQVHYPAILDVGVRVSEIRNRSFTLEYVIFRNATDEVVADGASVVAWVDYRENKAIPLPEELRRIIQKLDGLAGCDLSAT